MDPKSKEIADRLEFKENEKFISQNGILYRKFDNINKFAVSESMVVPLIREYHENLAHVGTHKIFDALNPLYWFPHMKARIQHVNNCLTCLMANTSSNMKEGEYHSYDKPTIPFEVVYIDHFGPLELTNDKYKYVFETFDAFTRFTMFFPTKTTNAKEVIKSLKKLLSVFGKSKLIISDRGSVFTSDDFTKFLKDSQIQLRQTAVASPWANGMMERVNRFLKATLTRNCENPRDWIDELLKIQFVVIGQ